MGNKITIFDSGLIEAVICTSVLSSPVLVFYFLKLWSILIIYESLMMFCLITVIIHFRFNRSLIKNNSKIDTLMNKKVKKVSKMQKELNI